MIFNRVLNFVFGGLLFVVFSSCSPCRDLDCIFSNYTFRFELVDLNTGENLITGPKAIYEFEDFSLYSLLTNDTVLYDLNQWQGFDPNIQSGIFKTDIFPPASALYLEYPDRSRDTLELVFSQRETECCGLITEIESITRNRSEVFQDIYEILVFKR